MILRAVSAAIRRRPLTSLVVSSGTGLLGYCTYLECQANLAEKLRLREGDPTNDGNNDQYRRGVAALPRVYDWQALKEYWVNRPLSTAQRFGQITYYLLPCAFAYIRDFHLFPPPSLPEILQQEHASRLREALTQLGPAFVKAGQQLSIRPDLVPPVVLKELQKLCDAVQPVDDCIALQVVRDELGITDLDTVFDGGLRLVASASLGQVYRGTLRTAGTEVAVKVQRPNIRRTFSLDLYLLQRIGFLVDLFTATFTKQPPFHQPLYESFAAGSYSELDYEQEAANQTKFQKELNARKCPVVIPDVYEDFTTEKIITSQWIDGVKLADSSKERIRELIPVGVELFLTQLLDIGAFHADPHPGNLLVTPEGKLCLLDFGLCAEVDNKSRNALTKAIVHLLYRDFDKLVAEDAIELGFLPADFDASRLKPLLSQILTVAIVEPGSNLHRRKKKLLEISNELNEVFFQYPFSVPPFFALVTRGLGLLEGIALTGDPDFDIFEASAPFTTKRAMSILGKHSMPSSWVLRSRRRTKAGM